MSRRITCTCAACRNVNSLDLKFMVHYGEYFSRWVREHHELVGLAPIFVQKREWKAAIAKSTDWRGYVLLSEDSLEHLDLYPDELQRVEVQPLGITCYGFDLASRYKAMMDAQCVVISPEEANADFKVSLPLSRPAVWEWLNDPQKRNQWYPSLLRWSARLRPGGRTGPGASNHCNHGVGNVIEKIIDWRPFDYYTVEMRAMPGNVSLLMTIRLDALSEEKTQAHGYLSMQNPRILAGPISALSARFLENRIQQIGYLVSKK